MTQKKSTCVGSTTLACFHGNNGLVSSDGFWDETCEWMMRSGPISQGSNGHSSKYHNACVCLFLILQGSGWTLLVIQSHIVINFESCLLIFAVLLSHIYNDQCFDFNILLCFKTRFMSWLMWVLLPVSSHLWGCLLVYLNPAPPLCLIVVATPVFRLFGDLWLFVDLNFTRTLPALFAW